MSSRGELNTSDSRRVEFVDPAGTNACVKVKASAHRRFAGFEEYQGTGSEITRIGTVLDNHEVV